MARKTYDEANIAAIAERIRANTGGNSTYNTEEMAGGVDEVYAAGIAEGKQAEYDAFWDAYQNNGKRVDYNNAFSGVGWTNTLFNPKYDIKPFDAYMIFRLSSISGDLVEILAEKGVTLDFSNAVSALFAFNSTQLTRIGEVNLSKCNSSGANYLFQLSSKLHTIDRIILPETPITFTDAFASCSKLANITIEGTIQRSLNVQSCPLTRASIESIISHLSNTTSGYTATFKKTAKEAAFTADEWAALIATKSNWTISLV